MARLTACSSPKNPLQTRIRRTRARNAAVELERLVRRVTTLEDMGIGLRRLDMPAVQSGSSGCRVFVSGESEHSSR